MLSFIVLFAIASLILILSIFLSVKKSSTSTEETGGSAGKRDLKVDTTNTVNRPEVEDTILMARDSEGLFIDPLLLLNQIGTLEPSTPSTYNGLVFHIINLERAPDRWDHLYAHLTEQCQVPSPAIHRFQALNRPGNGGLGCYLSHTLLLGQLITSNADKWTAILEDDFQFDEHVTINSLTQELQEMDTLLNRDKGGWDICILGHYVYDWEPLVKGEKHTYYRIWNGTTLSGYIVHPRKRQALFEFLIRRLVYILQTPGRRCKDHNEIDQVIRELFSTWTIVCRQKPWGYQRATVSTLYSEDGKPVDNRWTQLSDTKFRGQNGVVFPLRTRISASNQ